MPAAALLLGCPIKWIEDRRESFTATNHERVQDWEVEAAVRRATAGCSRSAAICATTTAPTRRRACRCRRTPPPICSAPTCCRPISSRSRCCLTNMVAATSTRGAGRPQGTYVMERLLDRIADRARSRTRRGPPPQPDRAAADALCHAGQDPRRPADDLRQRRLSSRCQRRALAAAGWTDFPARREAARREGRLIGIGHGQLRRRHRPRPVRKRGGARRTVRQDRGHHRRGRTGPGHPHDAGAARRRRARRRARRDPRGRRRHRREPARPRRLCQPAGGDRRQCRPSRRPHGRRQGAAGRRRPCSRSAPDDLELVDGAVRVQGRAAD